MRSSYLRRNHSVETKTKQLHKKNLVVNAMRIINLSLNKLKRIVKIRCIKGYKNLSKERLLSALNESELVESEENFHDGRIKKNQKRF